MAPSTSKTAIVAMLPTRGPKLSLNLRPCPKSVLLSRATISWCNAQDDERCLLLARQCHSETGNGLARFVARRGGDQPRHGKARLLSHTAKIGFTVTPAPLGTEFKSLVQFRGSLLDREKKESIRFEPRMSSTEHQSKVAQIDQRVRRQ